jgi:hypothetical protein
MVEARSEPSPIKCKISWGPHHPLAHLTRFRENLSGPVNIFLVNTKLESHVSLLERCELNENSDKLVNDILISTDFRKVSQPHFISPDFSGSHKFGIETNGIHWIEQCRMELGFSFFCFALFSSRQQL